MSLNNNIEFVDMLPWALMRLNPDLNVIMANAAARNAFKLRADSALDFMRDIHWVNQAGEPLNRENHPALRCFKSRKKIAGVILGFSPSSEEQITWIEAHFIPETKEGAKKPTGVMFTFIETTTPCTFAITDHTSEDETGGGISRELNEKQIIYPDLFEMNPQPMWIYDLETLRFLAVNHAAVEHYGYSREEFLEMTLKDIRPVEKVALLMEDIQQTTSELNHAGIWQHIKKSGEVIDVEITSHTVKYLGRDARHVMEI